MGFLSSLVKTVVGIGRAVIGLPPAAQAAAALPTVLPITNPVATAIAGPAVVAAGAAGSLLGRIGTGIKGLLTPATALGAAVGAGTTALVSSVAGGGGGAVPVIMGGGIGRGNGQFAKQTIVQTILVATGQVTRQEVFAGAPFAMQKDINRIRTLDRKLTRAANRVRSKSRGPSKQKQLTDAVVDTALRGVLTSCPPKC